MPNCLKLVNLVNFLCYKVTSEFIYPNSNISVVTFRTHALPCACFFQDIPWGSGRLTSAWDNRRCMTRCFRGPGGLKGSGSSLLDKKNKHSKKKKKESDLGQGQYALCCCYPPLDADPQLNVLGSSLAHATFHENGASSLNGMAGLSY